MHALSAFEVNKCRVSQSAVYVIDQSAHFDSEDDSQVVETSVTVINNSPIQDYVHQDDQTQPTSQLTFLTVSSRGIPNMSGSARGTPRSQGTENRVCSFSSVFTSCEGYSFMLRLRQIDISFM